MARAGPSELEFWKSDLSGRPVVGQQLGEPGNGMGGDAGEDVLEPTEGIDSSTLAGSHETPQHRGGLATFIAAKEYPVVAANGNAADRALGGVMPIPGLCRVAWIWRVPHCLRMMADAA